MKIFNSKIIKYIKGTIVGMIIYFFGLIIFSLIFPRTIFFIDNFRIWIQSHIFSLSSINLKTEFKDISQKELNKLKSKLDPGT